MQIQVQNKAEPETLGDFTTAWFKTTYDFVGPISAFQDGEDEHGNVMWTAKIDFKYQFGDGFAVEAASKQEAIDFLLKTLKEMTLGVIKEWQELS